MSDHHQVLIVGGGSAGLSTAALLCSREDAPDVAIIEPSDKHYYQPLWTLVGGGVFPREESQRSEEDFIPEGATWIRDYVESFDPENKRVTLRGGRTLSYDVLVVAAGIQLDWDKIEGLKENVGRGGICSNYSYDTVESTWKNIRGFKGGRAIFTYPSTPIKCAGAPQKIMWLAEHWFEKAGIREECEVVYASATAGIFGVERYAKPLNTLVRDREIVTHFQHDLKALRPASREAVFLNMASGEEVVMKYDMIHVTPPQSAPDFIKRSPLANDEGWVDVDMYTTQHKRYPDVFSLGDCSGLPNSKTAAAVRKQAPVLVKNLRAWMAGEPLTARYNGYASCPLVTGYGRLILAEFGYGGVPMETLPVDQARERYSTYATKAYALPRLYWHGMLRGRW